MKEYKLVIKKAIKTDEGDQSVIIYSAGQKLVVTEDIFNRLKKGETIRISYCAGHGYYTEYVYDKYNFFNEVETTEVTILYSKAKLGQRRSSRKERNNYDDEFNAPENNPSEEEQYGKDELDEFGDGISLTIPTGITHQ